MSRLFRAAVLAGLAILAGHSLAFAAPADNMTVVSRVKVSYSDLDLALSSDARVMLARLQDAANRACGGDPRRHPKYDIMPFSVRAAYQRCRSEALARAVADVNAPALWQAYEATQPAFRVAQTSAR